jgi:hypothetical protein
VEYCPLQASADSRWTGRSLFGCSVRLFCVESQRGTSKVQTQSTHYAVAVRTEARSKESRGVLVATIEHKTARQELTEVRREGQRASRRPARRPRLAQWRLAAAASRQQLGAGAWGLGSGSRQGRRQGGNWQPGSGIRDLGFSRFVCSTWALGWNLEFWIAGRVEDKN